MATTSFVNLRVYQLAEKLADLVWEIVGGWKGVARDTVGKQLVRSADSIGANIAEGSGRGTYADNRRFIRIARGSLYETRHWLRRAFNRKLLTSAQSSALLPLVEQFSPMLNAYLRSIGNGASSKNTKGD